MTRLLFLFLDGVGLGNNDSNINPFITAQMPNLTALLAGKQFIASSAPVEGPRATLLSLDACLGVAGLPQSATGQAVLLTGQNVPELLGYHYGPKPNPDVAAFLRNGNIFHRLSTFGVEAAFLNAYPPRYFEAISSGHRLYSAIPLAVTSAGLPLRDYQALISGEALAADFTAQGWHDHLGLTEAPIFTGWEAGISLARLASRQKFSFFEYWLSDYAGHRQDMPQAIQLLELLDQVLGGLLSEWDDNQGLVLVTSDHGNLEDLSTRRHTTQPVPALVIGSKELRMRFCKQMRSILDVSPAIFDLLTS
jgi:2,3-bisphosphoglycerate-independent phosphoglycerate mutase